MPEQGRDKKPAEESGHGAEKDRGVDPRVRAFISAHVGSIAELDFILLLHADVRREWTAAELARVLGLAPEWLRSHLKRLTGSGLLSESAASPPRYRYAQGSPELDETLAALAQAYTQRRLVVIEMIYENPNDRIRTFASAFKLRKDS